MEYVVLIEFRVLEIFFQVRDAFYDMVCLGADEGRGMGHAEGMREVCKHGKVVSAVSADEDFRGIDSVQLRSVFPLLASGWVISIAPPLVTAFNRPLYLVFIANLIVSARKWLFFPNPTNGMIL